MAYNHFPHHDIDIRRLNERLGHELGIDPLSPTQLHYLVDMILTSIPTDPQRQALIESNDTPVARMVAIPLFSSPS